MGFYCWKCGGAIELKSGERVGSRDECPRCKFSVHSCRNCRFYDPGRNNQCAEPHVEWVRDKEAANYCDYFQPATGAGSRPAAGGDQSGDVRKKFDSLFKL